MSTDNEHYMSQAIDLAKLAFANDEVPVGAVIVERKSNTVIAKSSNKMREKKNAMYHAEILSIQQACNHLQNERLVGCDIYVSLEPCPMCAGAAINARISHLIFGAHDPKAGATETLYNLLADPRLNHQARITSGVLADDCGAILSKFFADKR